MICTTATSLEHTIDISSDGEPSIYTDLQLYIHGAHIVIDWLIVDA